MTERRATVERNTSETSVRVAIDLGDPGNVDIATGVAFFDHMLDQLARHGRFGLQINAKGDLAVDAHHTVEDVGIALGDALSQALGDKRGIRRYGDALVPMEEALAQVALDISGRALLAYDVDVPAETVGDFDTGLTEEFFHAFVRSAAICLHVRLLGGRNAHHCVEAVFKGVARALGDAVALDPAIGDEVPSTKGSL